MTTDNSSISEMKDKNAETEILDDVNLDANAADSSPTEKTDAKETEPESLFDAVQAALNKEHGSDEDSSASQEVEKQDNEPDQQSDSTENTDEDDNDQPEFHKHPRWQEMLAENRELKEKTKDFEVVTEKAQNMDAFNQAIVESGLSSQEFNEGFEIMRAMKSDPARALELLAPHFQGLEEFTGQRLPDDLQQRVDAGQVDIDTATELATARRQQAFEKDRARVSELDLQSQRDAQAQQRHDENVNLVKSAVSEWETTWKGSDPDYSLKQPLVHDRVVALIQEQGAPATAEEAVKLSEQAREQVNQMLSKAVPQKRAIRRVPSGGSVTTSTEPKTLAEAVRLAAKG